jgi:hypothetical protein
LVRSLAVFAILAPAALVVLLSCGRRESPQPALVASPTIPKLAPEGSLTEADLQAYLAVRSKALQKLEDALNEVEKSGGDVLAHVQELTVAERDAARSLGVEWRRFTWVRDQVGRLLTTQRQREDQRMLLAELTRAKQDLTTQLEVSRDAASRQFLEAQLKVLDGQLEKIESEQHLPMPKAEEMKLLEAARAEIAILQGRQDRVQRRVQELLQRAARSGATPVPTSGSGR